MLRDTDPRGTVEELAKMEVDLSKVPSCSRRVVEDGQVIIRGCHEYKRCKLKERGKSGPVNKGVQVLKKRLSGSPVVSNIALTCYDIPGFAKRIENRDGVINIIAGEGDTIRVRGSKPRDEMIPGQGMVRIIDTMVLDEVVKAFPRPGTKGNLEENVLAAEIVAAHRATLAKTQPLDLLGLTEEASKIRDDDAALLLNRETDATKEAPPAI